MKVKLTLSLAVVASIVGCCAPNLLAQTPTARSSTAFSYQGFLRQAGQPADGTFDMTFRLRDATPGGGGPVGDLIGRQVVVENGVFTTKLDFGLVFDGTPFEMEVSILEGAQPIPLLPPQPICPTPQALYAETVGQVPNSALPGSVPLIVGGGLRLPDPSGSLRFGPDGLCSIGIDPQLPGLTERDPTGFRLLGQDGQGCRLIFGPTMDCTIEINPEGPAGLLLRDVCVRILPPTGEVPKLFLGPTDNCSIVGDPTGGLRLSDPNGIRVANPNPAGPARLLFGPTDDCTLGIDPQLAGLVERDPTGFRLLGQDSQGCRLIFGPTMDCTIEIDPKGLAGLLLRDPNGVRIINPDSKGNPALLFGPTDECRIMVDPEQGLLLSDPKGVRLINPNPDGNPALMFGPTDECRITVDPKQGLLLSDPNGVRIINPNTQGSPTLTFGPTDECRITVDPERGMLILDPNGLVASGPVSAPAFIQTSSRRYKDNIRPIENPLEVIKKLQGVRFDWTIGAKGKPGIGFIAEEVREVIPEVVAMEANGTDAKGLNYGHLVALAVEGIKDQQGEIERLRKENRALTDRLERLEQLIGGLVQSEQSHENRH